MNKRFGAIALVVAAVAAAAGLFASPAHSRGNSHGSCLAGNYPDVCRVFLTGAGPSPSTLMMHAGQNVTFFNTDSVTHTVVFANGLCSVTLTPGTGGINGGFCNHPFTYHAGSYAYTEDGKFPGTVVTKLWSRSVTLTARTHTIQGGTRLTLNGQVTRADWQYSPPASVEVLARHNATQPFKPIAWVHPGGVGAVSAYEWKLTVRPNVTTTYIAKVPGRQIWTNAKSRPFTVRIQH